jgi:hypothetical protein
MTSAIHLIAYKNISKLVKVGWRGRPNPPSSSEKKQFLLSSRWAKNPKKQKFHKKGIKI